MFNILSEAIFAFRWERLIQPAVIIGVIIMIIGMIILVVANKLSDFVIKLKQKNIQTIECEDNKKVKQKDYTWIFKLIAGVIVLSGALLAILMI